MLFVLSTAGSSRSEKGDTGKDLQVVRYHTDEHLTCGVLKINYMTQKDVFEFYSTSVLFVMNCSYYSLPGIKLIYLILWCN